MTRTFVQAFTDDGIVLISVRSDCKQDYLDWLSALRGFVPCDFLRCC